MAGTAVAAAVVNRKGARFTAPREIYFRPWERDVLLPAVLRPQIRLPRGWGVKGAGLEEEEREAGFLSREEKSGRRMLFLLWLLVSRMVVPAVTHAGSRGSGVGNKCGSSAEQRRREEPSPHRYPGSPCLTLCVSASFSDTSGSGTCHCRHLPAACHPWMQPSPFWVLSA